MSPSRHVHQGLWMPFQTCISFSLERFFLPKNQQDLKYHIFISIY